jgi:hypothetical protein
MTIEFKIHGCNVDDLVRQVADLHHAMAGPIEVHDDLADMPLNELIMITKQRCAEQGWQVEITLPNTIADEVDVIIPDKIARRTEPEESNEQIKTNTIAELKALYFDNGGTEIVETLRRKFGGKPFSEHPPEKFIGIRKALQEAKDARG